MNDMKMDLRGRIRNTQLPKKASLLPLFEAVVNSIHSTTARFGEGSERKGRITIKVHRDPQEVLSELTDSPPVMGISKIVITDNGVGFNQDNMESFQTADSTAKLALGGKGVGRFTWLIVFDRALIRSTFEEDSVLSHRRFNFELTQGGIENLEVEKDIQRSEVETSVELQGVRDKYHNSLRLTGEKIAQQIFEHCFGYFVVGRCPKITFIDEGLDLSIVLNERVKELHMESVKDLSIGGHTLRIRHVQKPARDGGKHTVHLCAHHRVVESFSLPGVSDLGKDPIEGHEGLEVYHHVFVEGEILDQSVNASRVSIDLPDDEPLLAYGVGLDKKQLLDKLGDHVNEHLAAIIQAEKNQNFKHIQNHIRTQAPEYRYLISKVPDRLSRIKWKADSKYLDFEFYKLEQEWMLQIRQQQANVEEFIEDGNVDALAEELSSVMLNINEAGQANLIRYVAKRRAVLTILKKLIRTETGKVLESHIHEIIFPQNKNADEVRYDDHNLWLFDDTLVFYEHLTSDQRLSKSVAQIASSRRPDLLAFKTGEPFQHIALVEFKRPDRDEEDPVNQLIEYAMLLRNGGAKHANGRTISKVAKSVRIDGFAIVSLTDKMNDYMMKHDLTFVPEEGRWYGYRANLNLHIEVVDFDAFITKAQQRNQWLFHKLNLPGIS